MMIGKEWPLVVFTLAVQMAAGLLTVGFCAGCFGLIDGNEQELNAAQLSVHAAALSLLLGLGAARFHLANPKNGWQAFKNLKSSWLSREVVVIFALTTLVSISALAIMLNEITSEFLFVIMGILSLMGISAVLVMSRVYLIPTVPVWNHWTTPADFTATSILLGLTTYTSILVGQYSSAADIFGNTSLSMVCLLTYCSGALRLIVAQHMALRKRVLIKKSCSSQMNIRVSFLFGGLILLFVAFQIHNAAAIFISTSFFLLSEIKGRIDFYDSFKTIGL